MSVSREGQQLKQFHENCSQVVRRIEDAERGMWLVIFLRKN